MYDLETEKSTLLTQLTTNQSQYEHKLLELQTHCDTLTTTITEIKDQNTTLTSTNKQLVKELAEIKLKEQQQKQQEEKKAKETKELAKQTAAATAVAPITPTNKPPGIVKQKLAETETKLQTALLQNEVLTSKTVLLETKVRKLSDLLSLVVDEAKLAISQVK